MKTCKIRLKEILQGSYFNQCFTREKTELIFYIICNGSSIGGTGKSRYSEDQIKCKVKNKLIKEVLPINWEIDEWLVYWVDFYSSFIAIYYTHMKYRESKIEAVRKKEFGTEEANQKKKLKFIWDKRKSRKRLVGNILEKYDQLLWRRKMQQRRRTNMENRKERQMERSFEAEIKEKRKQLQITESPHYLWL
jgi:hypothetical protein